MNSVSEGNEGKGAVEIRLRAESSAPAADVIAAARDFSERRIEIWPNVSARRYEVHADGERFAEVTEAAAQGVFWERSRYQWPRAGSVRQIVIDSNILLPGSTWEITATPDGDGCRVEAVFHRRFKRTLKGRFARLVNRRAGTHVYGYDLRRALAAIESQPPSAATEDR